MAAQRARPILLNERFLVIIFFFICVHVPTVPTVPTCMDVRTCTYVRMYSVYCLLCERKYVIEGLSAIRAYMMYVRTVSPNSSFPGFFTSRTKVFCHRKFGPGDFVSHGPNYLVILVQPW